MYKKIKVVFEKEINVDLNDPRVYKLRYFNLEKRENLPESYLNMDDSVYVSDYDGDLQGNALITNGILDNYYSKGDYLTIEQKEELEKVITKAGDLLTEIMRKIRKFSGDWSGTEVLEY